MKKIFILLFAMVSCNLCLGQSTEIKKLMKKAEQGDAVAMYSLGAMYCNGERYLRKLK